MNLPNKLSVLRICMVPVMSVFYLVGQDWATIISIIIFLFAVFTDFLDGYIARKTNQVTDLGKLLDPIADKLLVCFALFLVVEKGIFAQDSNLPVGVGGFCCSVIIGRELLVGLVRQIGASKGVVIHANAWGKIKAIFQYVAIPVLMLLTLKNMLIAISPIIYQVFYWVGIVAFFIATILTIISAIIYVLQNRHIFAETK